jgi:alkylhydroperoxidase family enzyme
MHHVPPAAPRAPRIAPLEPPFDEPTGQLLHKMNPPAAPNLLALFRVLAVNPRLMERMASCGGHFLGRGATLNLRDREIVIDRVCARCGAEYEWGVHVAAFAAAAELDVRQTDALARAETSLAVFTERDRLLVRMVDELHDTCDVSDALWSDLAAQWSPPQLIELLVLAGWYRAISYVCRVTGVPLEHWQARFPSAQ